jgi:hypothetical protein
VAISAPRALDKRAIAHKTASRRCKDATDIKKLARLCV